MTTDTTVAIRESCLSAQLEGSRRKAPPPRVASIPSTSRRRQAKEREHLARHLPGREVAITHLREVLHETEPGAGREEGHHG